MNAGSGGIVAGLGLLFVMLLTAYREWASHRATAEVRKVAVAEVKAAEVRTVVAVEAPARVDLARVDAVEVATLAEDPVDVANRRIAARRAAGLVLALSLLVPALSRAEVPDCVRAAPGGPVTCTADGYRLLVEDGTATEAALERCLVGRAADAKKTEATRVAAAALVAIPPEEPPSRLPAFVAGAGTATAVILLFVVFIKN